MQKNKVLGWIFIVIGAWYLLSGVVTNDMSGIASLGYNPDMPMSFQLAPVRFILGIVINALIVYCGIRMVRQQSPAN